MAETGGGFGGGLGGGLGMPGAAGGLGGELPTPPEMPAGDAGPTTPPPPGGEGAGGAEAEKPGALLATPPAGKRDSVKHDYAGGYTTKGSKGKPYYPVKKGKDGRQDGGKKRHWGYKRHPEQARNVPRNLFPGYADGLKALSKGVVGVSEGIYEEKESIYSLREQTEEDKLFEINESVRTLIEGLDKKETSEQENESETQQEAK